jgi:hypothetical protein
VEGTGVRKLIVGAALLVGLVMGTAVWLIRRQRVAGA